MLTAGVALLVLTAFLSPARGRGGQTLTIDPRPSMPLAGLLFLIAIVAVIRPQAVAGRVLALALAVVTAVAALFNLADAAIPVMFGRDLDLYSDLLHFSPLLGRATATWGLGRVALSVAGFVVAAAVLIVAAYWCWRRLLAVLADRRWALAAAILLGVVLNFAAWLPPEAGPLASGLGRGIIRQVADVEAVWQLPPGSDKRYAAALASPAPPSGDLAGLKRRDVYLVFIESYGSTVFDTPEFRAALDGPLAQFEAAISAAGYTVASNRLVAPTYGGGSWLAYATLASGVRLDDPVLYSRVLASGRRLLPAYFKAAGWRAIDITPGSKAPTPEAKAWDFDREIYAGELDYRGPSFGSFAIPDQFTLERAGAIRAALGPESPVFTQIELVSSHIPFAPVPPYLADWTDAGTYSGVPKSAWPQIYRQPDWARLAPAYMESLQYDFTVLRSWLCRRLRGNALVVLVGDHQPPAVVGGEGQSWSVPIHVLSRDPALVAPFLAAGYVGGMVPSQPGPHPGMENFLKTFLAAYDRRK
jgi:hypothetical protein